MLRKKTVSKRRASLGPKALLVEALLLYVSATKELLTHDTLTAKGRRWLMESDRAAKALLRSVRAKGSKRIDHA